MNTQFVWFPHFWIANLTFQNMKVNGKLPFRDIGIRRETNVENSSIYSFYFFAMSCIFGFPKIFSFQTNSEKKLAHWIYIWVQMSEVYVNCLRWHLLEEKICDMNMNVQRRHFSFNRKKEPVIHESTSHLFICCAQCTY